jgi:uncharacterized membrane protein
MTHINDISVILILAAGVVFSLRWKKLTVAAAVAGAAIGWLIYAGAGFTGLSLITVFFILGTAATSWKKNEKRLQPGTPSDLPDAPRDWPDAPPHPPETFPPGSGYQATRHAGQVIANAGVAAITGLLMAWLPHEKPLLKVMMAASFAAAAADTLSSELGMVYGRRFYNILTGKPDQKGLDGVISVEGLLFGLAGSVIIAILYATGNNSWDSRFFIILLAGTIGNLIDSLLGATLERRQLLSNDAVNFFNTLAAALAAGALAAWL